MSPDKKECQWVLTCHPGGTRKALLATHLNQMSHGSDLSIQNVPTYSGWSEVSLQTKLKDEELNHQNVETFNGNLNVSVSNSPLLLCDPKYLNVPQQKYLSSDSDNGVTYGSLRSS